jgi:heme oxygenase (mycobilin-producing)
VTVISTLECQFKQEHIDEGIDWLRKALAATRAFDGCLHVDVIQDHNDPTRIIAVEQWASLEHDQAYRAWRAGDGKITGGDDLFAAPRKLTVGVVLDNV